MLQGEAWSNNSIRGIPNNYIKLINYFNFSERLQEAEALAKEGCEQTEALNKQLQQLKVKAMNSIQAVPQPSVSDTEVKEEETSEQTIVKQETVIERDVKTEVDIDNLHKKDEEVTKLESKVDELQKEIDELRKIRTSDEDSVSIHFKCKILPNTFSNNNSVYYFNFPESGFWILWGQHLHHTNPPSLYPHPLRDVISRHRRRSYCRAASSC